ncbi:peptidoglycan DD-metalloendopeptidase family protein [Streptomyces sp. NPDC093109]|uniref:M23 family metallopeptidase n=1 Tax=Streptomyces sp. NPDC093109 TaxID=3154977 RepID=UPI00344E8AC1
MTTVRVSGRPARRSVLTVTLVLTFTFALTAGLAWPSPHTASAARADRVPDGRRGWPVGPPPVVERGWRPPASAYGPGHRGVDLAAPAGTPVRAAAAGRVSFVGPVGGRGVVSITLSGTGDPPLRITYEPVEPLVARGDEVDPGGLVGTVAPGPSHCATGCLHWGLLRGTVYLDPLSLLRRGPSRLLPVRGVPEPGPAP